MKLRLSNASPFARKCLIVAIEAGLDRRIERVPTLPWAPETDLPKDNPLGKVPALITDAGEALYDSPVICEYLDSLHAGPHLIPAAGPERWRQLRLQALGDGILDAAVQVRVESVTRPEDKRWPHWIDRQQAAIARGLDAIEGECPAWGDTFLIGQITLLSALGYIDFRSLADWRMGRPALTAWYDRVLARPSVAATVPRD